LTVTGSCKCQ